MLRKIPAILLSLLTGCASSPFHLAPRAGDSQSVPPAVPPGLHARAPFHHAAPLPPVIVRDPVSLPPPPTPQPPSPPVPPPVPPPTPPPVTRIPDTATSSGILDGSANWEWNHDPGTAGTSQGTTEYPAAGLSQDNSAREYDMTYTDYGGEIWHLSFARDAAATHFVYDTYVYLANPSEVANLEMDMNQVTADGDTVIYGMQCASGSGTWEYTTQTNAAPHWNPSNLPCSPKTWSVGWHHIQIASERTDDAGDVTYDWINLDGTYSDFVGATGNSALSLGWSAADLLLNFQIDGTSKTGGSITAYTDQMQVWRW